MNTGRGETPTSAGVWKKLIGGFKGSQALVKEVPADVVETAELELAVEPAMG